MTRQRSTGCAASEAAADSAAMALPGRIAIRPDDLRGPAILALLAEHLHHMREISPPGSVHALDLDGLRAPGLSFWTAWDGAELLGCGALKALDATHGEIKSMRTAAAHRRKGVSRAMLQHVLAEADRRGYLRVSLETGAQAAFLPARRLYESAGFTACGPFGAYVDDPHSVFMTRVLAPGPGAAGSGRRSRDAG